jgi:hypothetical protein
MKCNVPVHSTATGWDRSSNLLTSGWARMAVGWRRSLSTIATWSEASSASPWDATMGSLST